MNAALPALVDLRSDTVTRPSRGMREAMAQAVVGDDVYGEDPTTIALEEECAALFGFEAALFVSSGTMGNQLAIACQTRPGDEVVLPRDSHPVLYETGAGAALSGVQFKELGENGVFTPNELEAAMKPLTDYAPRTSMLSVENTHNRSGGRVVAREFTGALCRRAKELGLARHLDGARIWNAAVATKLAVRELAQGFDTATACFSKGLGAPVGSIFMSSRDIVARARRLRKMWGGGMRQVGILAAAAHYALQHHRERLVEDHVHARLLAEGLGTSYCPTPPETNIVSLRVHESVSARAVSERARAHHVYLNPTGPHELRAVTHLDVSRADVLRAADIIGSAIRAEEQQGSPS